jgi:hypothetical protein
MNPPRRLTFGTALPLVALATALIVAFRAWNQDFTIDEANTYFFYTSGLSTAFWNAGSNNHLLSSLLIRIAASVFGYSPFAMRLPAIVSGGLYAAGTAVLVSLLVDKARVWMRVCLFGVLVFNPFVMDYLVPARGYSPSMACEMAMLVLVARGLARQSAPGPSPASLIGMSVIGALGVAFNYSFLFTLSSLLFATFAFLVIRERIGRGMFAWDHAFAAGIRLFVPFVAIIAALCSNNIVTMPQSEIQIGWGSESFRQMFLSFSQLSFNKPNPFLTPPGLRHFVTAIYRAGPWIALSAFALSLVGMGVRIRYWVSSRPKPATAASTHDQFVWILLAALGVSLVLHALLFLLLGVKLPQSRTGIHLIPLMALIAASPIYLARLERDALDWAWTKLFAAAASLVTILFLFSAHFSYFEEWKWNADACAATDAALSYAEALHTKDVRISWEFDGAGNYYSEYLGYGFHTLHEVPEDQLLAGKDAPRPTVFLVSRRAWSAMDKAGLAPVYEAGLSGTVVAVRHPGDVAIPATPTHSHVDLHARCPEHDWYGYREDYPGPMLY